MLLSEKKVKTKHRDPQYFKKPRRTQDAVPMERAYENGMILSGGGIYSMCFRFTDVNYSIAEEGRQQEFIKSLRAAAKSCTPAEVSQITIFNRRINEEALERLRHPLQGDGFDPLRQELNAMLESQAGRGSGIIQDRFFTMSAARPTPREAETHFDRAGTELALRFAGMGSTLRPLGLSQRLRLLRDFYRPGDENFWDFDFRDMRRQGKSVKDCVAPLSLSLKSSHFKTGDKFGRVLAMTRHASFIDDKTLNKLTDLDVELVLSVSFIPIPTDEAVKFFQGRLDSVEANALRSRQKQLQRSQVAGPEPYHFRKDRANIQDVLDDITQRDCGVVVACVTLCHMAQSLEQLDADTELIRSTARSANCELDVCTDQQLDALNTVLPYGLQRLHIDHGLTTESLAAFVPFNAQEICDPGGVLYGQNVVTRNLVAVDRLAKSSGNGFVLGMTVGGKSFFCKQELLSLRLRYPPEKADFLILDPESEYKKEVLELGGEIYHIGKDSINPFDMELDFAEKNPLSYKTEFITACCEKIMGGGLDAQSKSLIDRAVRGVYREFLHNHGKTAPPLMGDFKGALEAMGHKKAGELSLALERFVDGYLNACAAPTNVDSDNSLICYSLNGLQDQMKSLGTVITLDHLLNRVMRNFRRGKITFVYADEFSLLFQDEETGAFFGKLWRRIRKYNGFCTGATQSVEEVLASESGRAMLANTDFVVMLNQSPANAQQLSELFGISKNQQSYFENVPPGHGLVKVGGAIVPFVGNVPRDTRCYGLMATDPREGSWACGESQE